MSWSCKDKSFEVEIVKTYDKGFIVRRTMDGKAGWLTLLEMDERCLAFYRNGHGDKLIGERLVAYAMMEVQKAISVSQFSLAERQERAQEWERWRTKVRKMGYEEYLMEINKQREENQKADQKYLWPHGLDILSSDDQ